MRPSGLDDFTTRFRQAVEHHLQGRFADALSSYNAAIRSNPNVAAAHCNRGLALASLKRFDDALRSYDRAIKLQPDYADAYYNRGIAFRQLDRLNEAVRSYDQAIRLRPDHVEACSNRGNALRDLKRPEEALASLDRAIALKPDFAEAHYNRANALQDLKRPDEALRSYDRAIKLKPDLAEAYNNRGNVLQDLERPEQALQSYDRALEFKPESAETYTGRGNALKELNRLDEALQSHNRAIELEPANVDANWNKSVCALLMGDFEEGWRQYEWRKKKSEPFGRQIYPQPEWSGKESLVGKTLFIHAEQGLGDTIQFCRYAILAREMGAKIIFAVNDPLIRLLKDLGRAIEVVGLTEAVTGFDYHVPLLSLPLALQTNQTNIPAAIPYLRAKPARVANWRDRLGSAGFRIGICWQGNRRAAIDIGRSFPLRALEGLAKIPNVRLISLQKYDGIEQLHDLPVGLKVEILEDDFDLSPDAFVDTAAVMENLDLIITSDTAVAHLAGALGRPAWIALKQIPDWRWLLDRSDSPWYPTVRLFRQTRRGDWSNVFADMETQLAQVRRAPGM